MIELTEEILIELCWYILKVLDNFQIS